jgi:hypothetical protein
MDECLSNATGQSLQERAGGNRILARPEGFRMQTGMLVRILSCRRGTIPPRWSLRSSSSSRSCSARGQLSSEQKGCSAMARKRYQKGTLVKQGIRDPKWFGQHREDVVDNSGNVRRVFRKVLLGTVRELPTRKLAQRRFDLVLSRINASTYRPGRVATFAEFV